MVKIYDKSSCFGPELKEAILSLSNSENPLVIRNALSIGLLDDWLDFLKEKCALRHDRRHYSHDEKMSIEDWWEVSYQPGKDTAYAYSKTKQPFHTDNAWFSDPAELNFFIMEKQAKQGGEQMFYYLSRLLDDLQSKEPLLYKDLSTVPVIIRKGDGKYANDTTIIREGDNPSIFWNYYRTEKPTGEIQNMCDGFFKFLESQESTNSVERIRCESGDSFCFHDQKMLHGRTSFEANQPFDRILYQSMWHFQS